jgi:hypothetical protein
MLRLRWYHLAALVFIVGMIASPALADEIVLTLDAVGVSACDTPWNESSCARYCLPSPQPEGVYIMPARLVVDVSTIEGIESIEVDYQEASDPGRTRVFLYDGDGTAFVEEWSQGMGLATFVLDATGHVVDQLAISGWEAAVWEIRLIGAILVDNEQTSFSALKAVYR